MKQWAWILWNSSLKQKQGHIWAPEKKFKGVIEEWEGTSREGSKKLNENDVGEATFSIFSSVNHTKYYKLGQWDEDWKVYVWWT